MAVVVEAEGGSNEVDDSSERQIEVYSTVEISEMYTNEIKRPAARTIHWANNMIALMVLLLTGMQGWEKVPMSEHSDDDAYVGWCGY